MFHRGSALVGMCGWQSSLERVRLIQEQNMMIDCPLLFPQQTAMSSQSLFYVEDPLYVVIPENVDRLEI